MRFDLGPSLPALKLELQAKVDAEAEQARLAYLTPGAGQALEYQATEAAARAFLAALAAGGTPDLADYPFLKAEADAIALAGGSPPPPEILAAVVVGEADAWVMAGSAIKTLRRGAKMAIDAATTAAEARAAAVVPWPVPS